jgi:hypothetical protein
LNRSYQIVITPHFECPAEVINICKWHGSGFFCELFLMLTLSALRMRTAVPPPRRNSAAHPSRRMAAGGEAELGGKLS